MNIYSIVWLVIFLLLLIIEIATPSVLVSIWFSLSALVVCVLTLLLNIEPWLQILIFIILGVLLLVILRNIMKSKMKNTFIPTNSDSLIDKVIKIEEDFKDNHSRTTIGGIVWTVEKASDEVDLKKGDKARIVSIEGNKLIVKEGE